MVQICPIGQSINLRKHQDLYISKDQESNESSSEHQRQ